jgi:hypothetical protein
MQSLEWTLDFGRWDIIVMPAEPHVRGDCVLCLLEIGEGQMACACMRIYMSLLIRLRLWLAGSTGWESRSCIDHHGCCHHGSYTASATRCFGVSFLLQVSVRVPAGSGGSGCVCDPSGNPASPTPRMCTALSRMSYDSSHMMDTVGNNALHHVVG